MLEPQDLCYDSNRIHFEVLHSNSIPTYETYMFQSLTYDKTMENRINASSECITHHEESFLEKPSLALGPHVLTTRAAYHQMALDAQSNNPENDRNLSRAGS